VYVSNRAPASVLIGTLASDKTYVSGTSELPAFTDSLPLTQGPSRVVLGKVRVPGTTYSDAHGTFDLEQRVFIVCFDSRRIYLYDPVRQVVDAIVTTGRGPFALAIDEQRGLGYVAHFTDSYLGVISLDQRFPNNYAQIIASVGIPTPPRASK
jgi:DNA-binding beta-propeller fold protein YncE